jgi:Protein phosphatase 2C
MLTFVEAISLAGDRGKQNDDALGFAAARAWVLDGATDLDDKPLMGGASDAAWIAHVASAHLYGAAGDLRAAIGAASTHASKAFHERLGARSIERWQSPISSLLVLEESSAGIRGLDLGDSRVFALGADGGVFVAGGPDDAADDEAALAARQTDADKPLLRRTDTIAMLRRMRAELNQPGSRWTFCLDPACADRARAFAFTLTRPAHVLLMTDGFSALVDRYRAYDAGGLVRAALEKGLQELGRELRAIENADEGAALHPRFKKSDDATALLMRLN